MQHIMLIPNRTSSADPTNSTVYANSAHAWVVVAGIALDTADYGGAPVPAGSGPRWRAEPLANLGDGTNYVTRHPSGL
jgi:hypothetical protein